MARANIWTYTEVDYNKVRAFADVNNLARHEQSIADFRNNNTHHHMMSTYVGNKGNLRVIAAYALALEQIAKPLQHSFMDVDITV